MRKFLTIVAAVLLGAASLWARPAFKGAVTVKQPDGTSVTIRLHGDEYSHFNTTVDGYSIVKNAGGFYVYAEKKEGRLVPTDMVAHDMAQRSASEKAFLSAVPKMLQPEMTADNQEWLRLNRAAALEQQNQRRATSYDYSKFRGLVLLVEYNDCKFRYDDYKDIMERMLNEENYRGEERTNIPYNAVNRPFINALGKSGDITCKGSMSDYFRDNSNGKFVPKFDVVGPLSVNRSQFYAGGKKHTNDTQLMIDAINAADSQVNFRDYDVNGDGTVDIIYVVFAGLPSYITGNDERLLWPHQSNLGYFTNMRKDGVRMGYYSCSTELFGYEAYDWSILEGIGTMCHEFSHALGLMDFYDTGNLDNDSENCEHPGLWSLMSSGTDYDYGRSPCGYSLFERYSLGFAQPEVISQEGSFTLQNLSESNAGYRLDTPVKSEFFMLENRQKSGWDSELPGHGLLIHRVDSSQVSYWTRYNSINDNPDYPGYLLVRAGGVKNKTAGAASDPFPGTGKVTRIDNTTQPANLLTRQHFANSFGISDITEKGGVISFQVYEANKLVRLDLIEQADMGVGTTLQLSVVPFPENVKFTVTWASDNEAVATVSQTGLVTGVGEGTASITATADNGVQATCVVTVASLPVAQDIAAFRQLAEGGEALLQLNDAQVVFVYNKNLYVRDASGAIILSNTGLSASEGSMLSGSVYGRLTLNNRMPMLAGVSGKTATNGVVVAEGEAAQPREVTADELTDDLLCDYVLVKGTRLERSNGIWAVGKNLQARLYNPFSLKGIKVPADISGKYFDVTAIFGTNTLSGETVYELGLLKSPQEAAMPDAISTLSGEAEAAPAVCFDLNGRRLAAEPARGVFLVRQNGRIVKRMK